MAVAVQQIRGALPAFARHRAEAIAAWPSGLCGPLGGAAGTGIRSCRYSGLSSETSRCRGLSCGLDGRRVVVQCLGAVGAGGGGGANCWLFSPARSASAPKRRKDQLQRDPIAPERRWRGPPPCLFRRRIGDRLGRRWTAPPDACPDQRARPQCALRPCLARSFPAVASRAPSTPAGVSADSRCSCWPAALGASDSASAMLR